MVRREEPLKEPRSYGNCAHCGAPLTRSYSRYCQKRECKRACKRQYNRSHPRKNTNQQKEFKVASLSEIQEFRKTEGLRLLKPGEPECLGCGRKFKSPDVVTIRMCDSCKYTDAETRIGGVKKMVWKG